MRAKVSIQDDEGISCALHAIDWQKATNGRVASGDRVESRTRALQALSQIRMRENENRSQHQPPCPPRAFLRP